MGGSELSSGGTHSRWQDLVAELEPAIDGIPREDLPLLIGGLARLEARVRLRLAAPVQVSAGETEDRLLTAREVAERLHEKPSWVYAHQRELPAVALPGRTLRFSERRLAGFIRRRTSG